jgi:hypothetical protein
MKKDTLELTESDVKAILQEDYLYYQTHVAVFIFCGHCSRDHATVGIKEYSITLNADNDMHLKGKCTLCNRDVGCYLEYGEVPLLYHRAEDLRKALRNRSNMKVVKKD